MRTLLSSPIAWISTAYVALLFAMPWDGFWVNDNGLKFIQLQGIEASGYRDFDVPWPGREIDPTFRWNPLPSPFSQVVDGQLVATYSPVFALASSLPHRLLGMAGLYLLPLLGSLGVFLAVRRLAAMLCPQRDARRRAGNLAAGLTAFATPVVFYSFTFWEHTPALACACWGLVACLRLRERPSASRAAVLGLAVGGAIALRTDAYLLAGILAAVGLGQRRSLPAIPAFALALLVVLAPLWGFQWAASGHPLGPHLETQGWAAIDPATHLRERATAVWNILLNAHAQPAISMAASLPFLGAAAIAWRRRGPGPRPDWLEAAALGGAAAAGAVVLWGHWTAPQPMRWLLVSNGLFAASPILILGLVPPRPVDQAMDLAAGRPPDASGQESDSQARTQSRRHTLLAILALDVGLYVVLVPALNTAGIHWGCRFLLLAYPALAALAAPALLALWTRRPGAKAWVRGLAMATLALSVLTQLYAVELLRTRKQFTSGLVAAVAATPGDFVVTRQWYLPQDLAAIFYERPIYVTRNPEHRKQLLEEISSRPGPHRIITLERIDPRASPPPNAEILSDGWLGFSTLAMRMGTLQPGGPPAEESSETGGQ